MASKHISEDGEEYKPGQKKDAPPPGAGTRVFYESLYKQNPNSLMALKWCLEYGVLPRDDCEKALVKLEKLKAIFKEGQKNRSIQKLKEETEEIHAKKKRKKNKHEEHYKQEISQEMAPMMEATAPPPFMAEYGLLPEVDQTQFT